jgi:hypothetical protein
MVLGFWYPFSQNLCWNFISIISCFNDKLRSHTYISGDDIRCKSQCILMHTFNGTSPIFWMCHVHSFVNSFLSPWWATSQLNWFTLM